MAVSTKGKRDGSLMNFVGSSYFARALFHSWVCGWPWKKIEAWREEVYHVGLLSLRRVNAGEGQQIL